MTTNLAGWERVLRALIGVGLVLAGVALFAGTEAIGGRAIAGALGLLGLDLLTTGLLGFCPLYQRLGWRTAPPPRTGR